MEKGHVISSHHVSAWEFTNLEKPQLLPSSVLVDRAVIQQFAISPSLGAQDPVADVVAQFVGQINLRWCIF